MKVFALLQTKEGGRLARKGGRGGGDPPELETYYSPGSEIALYCSTGEREEFERDTDADLKADVLTAREFADLARWLSENSALRFSGVYRGQ